MSRQKLWQVCKAAFGLMVLTRLNDKLYELDRRADVLEKARASETHFHVGGPLIGVPRDTPPSWRYHA